MSFISMIGTNVFRFAHTKKKRNQLHNEDEENKKKKRNDRMNACAKIASIDQLKTEYEYG